MPLVCVFLFFPKQTFLSHHNSQLLTVCAWQTDEKARDLSRCYQWPENVGWTKLTLKFNHSFWPLEHRSDITCPPLPSQGSLYFLVFLLWTSFHTAYSLTVSVDCPSKMTRFLLYIYYILSLRVEYL